MKINFTKNHLTINLSYKVLVIVITLITTYFGITLPDVVTKILSIF